MESDKIYIHSPILLQDLYENIKKSFSNCIPIHTIPINLNEEDIDTVIDEIVINADFQKSDTELETFDRIEGLKNTQEFEINSIINLDHLNEKEINNDKIQAMFKRGRLNNLSIFIFSQDYYELPKKTVRVS